ETARLIERPALIPTRRMSGRRSYTSTRWPRRARKRASSDPTGPAPTMVSASATSQLLAQQLREALRVGEPAVERRRRDAQDVRGPRVADRPPRAQALHQPRRIVGNAQREHRAAA